MYSLDNIYKSFDNNQVLKGVSLEIPKNKTTVLIGPSGSGKSTLLSLIQRHFDVSLRSRIAEPLL